MVLVESCQYCAFGRFKQQNFWNGSIFQNIKIVTRKPKESRHIYFLLSWHATDLKILDDCPSIFRNFLLFHLQKFVILFLHDCLQPTKTNPMWFKSNILDDIYNQV